MSYLSDLPLYVCYVLQSEDEREMCSRTIYCTNIDKKVVLGYTLFESVSILSFVCFCVYNKRMAQIFDPLSCQQCRLHRQMLNSSLNLFAERFVAFLLMIFILIIAAEFQYLMRIPSHNFGEFIQVQRLRLLGDYHHSTRIAFVEFAMVTAQCSLLDCFITQHGLL